MVKTIFSILFLFSFYFSNTYTNCDFKNKDYSFICKKLLKRGVSVDYSNSFLLSSKTKKIDKKTLKYISPKKIKFHQKQEKIANNKLIKHIPKTKKHLKTFKKVYDLAEKKYNVNREIIAAILLKETFLGDYKPKHDAFVTLNTILTNLKPNSKRNKRLINFSKNNIISLIEYCYDNNIKIAQCNFKSSYIGAVGYSQFIPTNFHLIQSYSNSFSKLDNLPDSILSTANFLNKNANFNKLINWETFQNMKTIENNWYDFDFKTKKASFAKNGKYNCYSCSKPELQNVKNTVLKLMKYNNSSNYAIGVLRIAYESSFSNK